MQNRPERSNEWIKPDPKNLKGALFKHFQIHEEALERLDSQGLAIAALKADKMVL